MREVRSHHVASALLLHCRGVCTESLHMEDVFRGGPTGRVLLVGIERRYAAELHYAEYSEAFSAIPCVRLRLSW
jgi:hypothetical protein